MSEIQTVPVDLEELLDQDIPCEGIRTPQIARQCGRPAVLKSNGHGHRDTSFKCVECWQVWYRLAVQVLARSGCIGCMECGQLFDTVESFADYRPF